MVNNAIACQCHLCQSVFEKDRKSLVKGDAFCPSCNAPLSVLNIVPEWDDSTSLTDGGGNARN